MQMGYFYIIERILMQRNVNVQVLALLSDCLGYPGDPRAGGVKGVNRVDVEQAFSGLAGDKGQQAVFALQPGELVRAYFKGKAGGALLLFSMMVSFTPLSRTWY